MWPFGKKKLVESWKWPERAKYAGKGLGARRWAAGGTDRLNEAHWTNATGSSLNQDLSAYLSTIRARTCFEASVNDFIKGMIFRMQTDVVGGDGPRLQVEGENKKYCEALENAWQSFFEMPDLNGQIDGVAMLKLWIRQLFTHGEFLAQFVTDRTAGPDVQFRILSLNPSRLRSPMTQGDGDRHVMGIDRTKTGRPVTYHIAEDSDYSTKFMKRRADEILHGFEVEESEQARGVPWLASSLQAMADLRDFDIQVLDAMRAAADSGIHLFTNHVDAEYVEVDEEIEIERRTISTMPPGWEPRQMTPGQPHPQYIEYRMERLRELGLGHGMPLMMILLDSRQYNYSSARFDGQSYLRALRSIQSWLSRLALNRLANEVGKEVRLTTRIGNPGFVRYEWTWPQMPHVDPSKESNAEKQGLENKTLTLSEACAARGKDWEQVLEQSAREKKKLEELGLADADVKEEDLTESQKKGVRALVEEAVEEVADSLQQSAVS